jgi:hypothetical protein
MEGILKLPAPIRHLLVLVGGVLLTWGTTELVPYFHNQSNVYGALIASVIAAIIAWATPLVTSYGAGATRARELGARTVDEAVHGERHR